MADVVEDKIVEDGGDNASVVVEEGADEDEGEDEDDDEDDEDVSSDVRISLFFVVVYKNK